MFQSRLPPFQTATPLEGLTQGRGPNWPYKWASGHLDGEFLETLALNHSLNCAVLNNGEIHSGLKMKVHGFQGQEGRATLKTCFLKSVLLKHNVRENNPDILLKCRSRVSTPGVGLQILVSNMLPGDLCLEPTLWVARHMRVLTVSVVCGCIFVCEHAVTLGWEVLIVSVNKKNHTIPWV